MDNCIFCKIVKGELPSAKVWENETHLAFLTIAPINPGHTLLIPKKHTDYIFDLEDKELEPLLVYGKPIAKALRKTFIPATGKIGLMVAGGEVAHVHIHLIPMNKETDLNFANAKHDISFEQLQETVQKIKANL